jgi:hypothetical protein
MLLHMLDLPQSDPLVLICCSGAANVMFKPQHRGLDVSPLLERDFKSSRTQAQWPWPS